MKTIVARAGAMAAVFGTMLGAQAARAVVAVEAAPAAADAKPLETQAYGSDDRSVVFQKEVLPSITDLLRQSLGEAQSLKNSEALALDPDRLVMKNTSDIRVYFVGEGAGYFNTLGYNILDSDGKTLEGALGDDPQIIFENASSVISSLGSAPATVKRTSNAPLLPGDYADLGEIQAGSLLDFFLISDGARGGKYSFAASAERNPDGINHVVAFALPDSPYLILGFEDMYGGGDMDFNDVLFAVDIGVRNVRGLVGAPEPGAWAILGGFLLIGARGLKRRLVATEA